MRHWMTGFGTGLLVVLMCLSVQAQNVEQRIEKLESSMSNITDALPSWVQRFTFEGDLRLRYQYEDTTGEVRRPNRPFAGDQLLGSKCGCCLSHVRWPCIFKD
jgi:hypothetical protein